MTALFLSILEFLIDQQLLSRVKRIVLVFEPTPKFVGHFPEVIPVPFDSLVFECSGQIFLQFEGEGELVLALREELVSMLVEGERVFVKCSILSNPGLAILIFVSPRHEKLNLLLTFEDECECVRGKWPHQVEIDGSIDLISSLILSLVCVNGNAPIQRIAL